MCQRVSAKFKIFVYNLKKNIQVFLNTFLFNFINTSNKNSTVEYKSTMYSMSGNILCWFFQLELGLLHCGRRPEEIGIPLPWEIGPCSHAIFESLS